LFSNTHAEIECFFWLDEMGDGLDGDGAEANGSVTTRNGYPERHNYRDPNLPFGMVNAFQPIRQQGLDLS
jgi:hypothetical protein